MGWGSPAEEPRTPRVEDSIVPHNESILQMGKQALERIRDSPHAYLPDVQGCVYVTVHESSDLLDQEMFGKMVRPPGVGIAAALDLWRRVTSVSISAANFDDLDARLAGYVCQDASRDRGNAHGHTPRWWQGQPVERGLCFPSRLTGKQAETRITSYS